MKIDKGIITSFILILTVAGILLSLGAYLLIAPIVMGSIANVAVSGQIPMPVVFQEALNNTSNAFASVFGTDLPTQVAIGISLFPIAIVLIVFAFIIYPSYQKSKSKGKKSKGGDKPGVF